MIIWWKWHWDKYIKGNIILNKTDYVIRQIAKSYKKKYENYVVTRIWHLINNLDLKFVTQQHVTRPEGRALTDMYFPQIQLHIEVDEPHHYHFDFEGKQTNQDAVRELDIINATTHSLERINCCGNLESINNQIDNIVYVINQKIESKEFVPWDIDAEYNPQTYIDKGSISVQDNVAFLTIKDACNCFGHKYEGYQRATAKHAFEEGRMLWFPKLYENEGWNNEISLDEEQIFMQKKVGHKEWFKEQKNKPDNFKEWLVFARVRSNLGDVMYRFKGVFKSDQINSEILGKVIFNRVEKTVKTYKPLNRV